MEFRVQGLSSLCCVALETVVGGMSNSYWKEMKLKYVFISVQNHIEIHLPLFFRIHTIRELFEDLSPLTAWISMSLR